MTWIESNATVFDSFLICTDSQAALKALQNVTKLESKGITSVRNKLDGMKSKIFLQWVPGHCGLTGNEWADEVAGDAAGNASKESIVDPSTNEITFQAVKAFIKREMKDPPTTHIRTMAVYEGTKSKTIFPRKDEVMMAQLRSGHCHRLAAYRNVVHKDSSPLCPHCEMDYETLEHWLQCCPATAVKRIHGFGGPAPPLAVLVEDPKAVIAYTRSLVS